MTNPLDGISESLSLNDTALNLLDGTDSDGQVVSFRITELPTQGQLFLGTQLITDTTLIITHKISCVAVMEMTF